MYINILPIEAHQDLLQEYGRALAWINMVEFDLNWLIKIKGKLIEADFKIVDDILNDMMIGKKIRIAEQFIDKKIIADLGQLNERRLILVHGISGANKETGEMSIEHKKKEQPLTKKFLEDTTVKAKLISEELSKGLYN